MSKSKSSKSSKSWKQQVCEQLPSIRGHFLASPQVREAMEHVVSQLPDKKMVFQDKGKDNRDLLIVLACFWRALLLCGTPLDSSVLYEWAARKGLCSDREAFDKRIKAVSNSVPNTTYMRDNGPQIMVQLMILTTSTFIWAPRVSYFNALMSFGRMNLRLPLDMRRLLFNHITGSWIADIYAEASAIDRAVDEYRGMKNLTAGNQWSNAAICLYMALWNQNGEQPELERFIHYILPSFESGSSIPKRALQRWNELAGVIPDPRSTGKGKKSAQKKRKIN